MAGATKRAGKAGKALGDAIIEMIHLMYQNNAAAAFMRALCNEIMGEMQRRNLPAPYSGRADYVAECALCEYSDSCLGPKEAADYCPARR